VGYNRVPVTYIQETFTPEEAQLLSQFVSNLDKPVFALTNLPEVVKGALFARYSRSDKSVRRLLLDEFLTDADLVSSQHSNAGAGKAESLYGRIFLEYGDDSVAQLGGVHLACEQASNLLTKVLEWGRIASYLEQSTRYISYATKLGGKFRYFTPPELSGSDLAERYEAFMISLFETYSDMIEVLIPYFEEQFPQDPDDSNWVWRSTIKAKAFDTVRGMLPASTLSNVGIYASGQAYEMALIRMQASPLAEARDYGELMLTELRKVIPAFMSRVDLPERGIRASEYLAKNRAAVEAMNIEASPLPVAEVILVDWDPEAELKLAAAALYSTSEQPDTQLLAAARRMTPDQIGEIIAAYVGDRTNRRHKPGRAAERTYYRFDILSDYGSFRDLQRHRMLTIEWQRLGTRFGYDTPELLADVGLDARWHALMAEASELFEAVNNELGPDVAQYVVPFCFKIRYNLEMNVREAFHLLELRTQPSGHPAYRRVCQDMHRQISEVAGHHQIAAAMKYVNYDAADLERLEESRRIESKRRGA